MVHSEDVKQGITIDSIKNCLFTDNRELISNEDFYKMSRRLNLCPTYGVDWPSGGTWFIFEPTITEIVFTFDSNLDPLSIDSKELLEQCGINSKYLDIMIWSVKEDDQGNKRCGFSVTWSHEYYEEFDPLNNISSIEDLYLFATVLISTGDYDYDYCGVMKSSNYIMSREFLRDVNFDGVFNTKDIVAMKRCIVSDMSLYNSAALDQNKDGSFNAKDIKVLKSKIANG